MGLVGAWWRALAPVALCAALAGGAPGVVAEEGGRRAAMGSILESMRTLTTASSSLERFSAPEHEAEVIAALGELSDQAAMLAEHAGARSDVEEFLASTLERYATWTRRAYERGDRSFMKAARPGELQDGEGGTWRVTEAALEGPDGARLPRVAGRLSYWFAWDGYWGIDSTLYAGPQG